MQKEAYKTLTKEQQRFWKRILIVDDDADLAMTFRAAIEQQMKGNKDRIVGIINPLSP